MAEDEPRSMAPVAVALSNLISACRTVNTELKAREHESADWVERATSCLWQALGFANPDRVALGVLDSAPGRLEEKWPADARAAAIAHNQRIFAIDRDGATYYSARLDDEGPLFWSADIDLAYALLCATNSLPCVPEALSRIEG